MTITEPTMIVRKDYAAAEIGLTPGERSFVAWVTMDVVDNEGDVVVAGGVDFRSVYMGVPGDPEHPGNPVVMAVHDYKRWPLGTCDWMKLAKPSARQAFSGLYAKALVDEDEDALKVFGMIRRRVVKGVSIGFRPPDDFRPGEWAPPTADELKARPDWRAARRVIRRCVLLEWSVCPIGMNQAAVIVAVSKGGLELPSYLKHLLPRTGEPTMAEHHDTPGVPGRTAKIIRHEGDKWVLYDHTGKHRLSEHDTEDGALAQERAIEAHKHTDKSIGDHARHAPSGVCGIVKALHPTGDVPEDVEDGRGDADDKTAPAVSIDLHDAKCMPTGVVKAFAASELEPMDGPGVVDRPEAERPASEKGMGEGSGTAGGYTVTPEDEVAKDMDDGDEETEAMDAPEPEPTPPPITKGDRVYFPPHGGMAGGVGVVKSIHRSGKVPGCVNDAAASDDNPHARIQLYKSMGHPLHFHASDDHAAVPTSRCKQLPTIEVEPATKSYGEQAMVEIPVGDKLRLVTLNGPPPGTKGAVAFKSGATVAGEWHEDRARLRLTKAFAESHPAHHRAAFAWFDADRPDDAKAYWGLHHDIEFGTGRVIANAAACNRLLARLDAAELPPGDKPAIRKHLELHLSEAEGASADADESASPTEKALSRIPPFRTEAEWREEQRKAFREVYGGPDAAEILRQAENALYGVIE